MRREFEHGLAQLTIASSSVENSHRFSCCSDTSLGHQKENHWRECLGLTSYMAERHVRHKSAYKAWLEAEAEHRVSRAQHMRTRNHRHWPSGTRIKYWRADVNRSGVDTRARKPKGGWLGPVVVRCQERGRAQEGVDLPKGVVWIVVMGRLLRVAPEHLRPLSERED